MDSEPSLLHVDDSVSLEPPSSPSSLAANSVEPEGESSQALPKNGVCPVKHYFMNGSNVVEPTQKKPGHTSINAKVESVLENKRQKSLQIMAVRDYCQKLFEFQEITIRKFKYVRRK